MDSCGSRMDIECVVAWICGLEDVRETILFLPMLYRLTPSRPLAAGFSPALPPSPRRRDRFRAALRRALRL